MAFPLAGKKVDLGQLYPDPGASDRIVREFPGLLEVGSRARVLDQRLGPAQL